MYEKVLPPRRMLNPMWLLIIGMVGGVIAMMVVGEIQSANVRAAAEPATVAELQENFLRLLAVAFAGVALGFAGLLVQVKRRVQAIRDDADAETALERRLWRARYGLDDPDGRDRSE